MELRSRVSVPPAAVIWLLQSHHEPKSTNAAPKNSWWVKSLTNVGTSRVFGERISVGRGHKASFSGSVKHSFTFIEDRDFIYRYQEEKT